MTEIYPGYGCCAHCGWCGNCHSNPCPQGCNDDGATPRRAAAIGDGTPQLAPPKIT